MHVLILIDGSFAKREHSLLARLEIGLADEGFRVAHAIPADCRVEAAAGIYSLSLKYEQHGTIFSRSARARRLVEAFGEAQGDDEGKIDIVHAFGAETWDLAMEIARQTGAKLVLEVWSGALLHAAGRLTAEGSNGEKVPAFFTPGRILADQLRKAAPGAPVFLTPWGVAASDDVHMLLEAGRAPAAAIMATGKDPGLVGAALEGLAEAGKKSPDLVVFLDGQAGDRPAIWKRARRLKLLDRLTVVADMEERREPILRIDLLLQPEPLAEHHSMTLSAMASGTLVIATPDPLVESLKNDETAVLVRGASPLAWEQAIGGVLDNPTRARSVAAHAREYVRDEHSLTGHVRSVCAAYESIRGAPAMK